MDCHAIHTEIAEAEAQFFATAFGGRLAHFWAYGGVSQSVDFGTRSFDTTYPLSSAATRTS
ncbi:hypothetical protein ABFA25_12470 [Mycobacterium lepromatosis]|uniref:hypothetical protein n=1 Tax=Mycobacterium lepromatosis TaxID=480418 RepID=UPI0005F77AF3|nr:hypothetical protein [Mycobacterium lepromatosis]